MPVRPPAYTPIQLSDGQLHGHRAVPSGPIRRASAETEQAAFAAGVDEPRPGTDKARLVLEASSARSTLKACIDPLLRLYWTTVAFICRFYAAVCAWGTRPKPAPLTAEKLAAPATLDRHNALRRRQLPSARPRADQVAPMVPEEKKNGPDARFEEELQPHETCFVAEKLGRSGTGSARIEGVRAKFRGRQHVLGAMRTPAGRVTDRALVHAFSLAAKPLEGTYLRESLREIAEQGIRFVEGARAHLGPAQAQIASLLPGMLKAMRWAELSWQPGPTRHLQVAEDMAATLRGEGRILVPMSAFVTTSSEAGHAILIDIERMSDNTYSLRVINTGLGAEIHHAQRSALGSLRRQATWEVEGVGEQDICRPAALAELLQARAINDATLREGLTNLYALLAAKGSVAAATGRYQKPQQIGNCAWKSVMAYLKANCDEVSYRTFKTYLRSRLLDQAITQMVPDGPMPAGASVERSASSAVPHIGYSKKELFAQADAKVQRDISRLSAVDRRQIYHPPTPPLAPPRRGKLTTAFHRRGLTPSHPANAYLVTDYVLGAQAAVNEQASARLIASLHRGESSNSNHLSPSSHGCSIE